MNIFTVYKTSTGAIQYTTSTSAAINEVGIESDESIIVGSYAANEYKISSGSAVARTDNVLDIVRGKRDTLLTQSDWTQTIDSPLSDAKKAEWVTYRQSLRDLPANNSSASAIDDVTFPTQP